MLTVFNLSQLTKLDSSKLKNFADDLWKFDENGGKFSMQKGSKRAISPFPMVFTKDLYCKHIKTRACLGKG